MMKYAILVIFFLGFVFACQKRNEVSEQTPAVIPDMVVSAQDSSLKIQQGILFFRGSAFSGFIEQKYENGQIASKNGYLNGQMEGKQEKFYPDGSKEELRFYHENRKVGNHKGWWQNGKQKFDYTIENDISVGEHREWYENGQLFSLTNYNQNGQPEGKQQTWYSTGQIKSNFVLKNGRRFGFMGAKGCMGENEKKQSGLEFKNKQF